MDSLSNDVIVHLILSIVPIHALTALQFTSKRYHRLVRNFYLKKAQNKLEALGEICENGFLNLLSWFLGRGISELRWSLLVEGVKKLLCHGKYFYLYQKLFELVVNLFIRYSLSSCSWRACGAVRERVASERGDGRWP